MDGCFPGRNSGRVIPDGAYTAVVQAVCRCTGTGKDYRSAHDRYQCDWDSDIYNNSPQHPLGAGESQRAAGAEGLGNSQPNPSPF